MSVPATSPRRATLDAIALAFAFIAVDALVIVAVLSEWLENSTGVVAVLALAAIVLLLYRDDVADAIASGNQKLGLSADDAGVRDALGLLVQEGWTVQHDVSNERGVLIGTLVQGPSGAYIVEVRNRAYRLEHLRRVRRDAWVAGWRRSSASRFGTTRLIGGTASGSWVSTTWRRGCAGERRRAGRIHRNSAIPRSRDAPEGRSRDTRKLPAAGEARECRKQAISWTLRARSRGMTRLRFSRATRRPSIATA
jgi:hypothetical protein